MEPIIHSHIEDMLPDDHPLAFEQVHCDAKFPHKCNGLLHAANNECMTTWIEFAGKNICAEAFALFLLSDFHCGVLREYAILEFLKSNKNKFEDLE